MCVLMESMDVSVAPHSVLVCAADFESCVPKKTFSTSTCGKMKGMKCGLKMRKQVGALEMCDLLLFSCFTK